MGLKDLFSKPDIPVPAPWDEGPDDTWPSEPEKTATTRITHQWGLRLPDGEVAWNSWQGVPFDNPLDRVHMIARLQQTAQDTGWSELEFLAAYGWVTREEHAQVTYHVTGSYPLTDPAVSGTPEGELT